MARGSKGIVSLNLGPIEEVKAFLACTDLNAKCAGFKTVLQQSDQSDRDHLHSNTPLFVNITRRRKKALKSPSTANGVGLQQNLCNIYEEKENPSNSSAEDVSDASSITVEGVITKTGESGIFVSSTPNRSRTARGLDTAVTSTTQENTNTESAILEPSIVKLYDDELSLGVASEEPSVSARRRSTMREDYKIVNRSSLMEAVSSLPPCLQSVVNYLLSEVEGLENEVKSLKDDAAKENEAKKSKLEATVVQLEHAFAILHEKYMKSRSVINGRLMRIDYALAKVDRLEEEVQALEAVAAKKKKAWALNFEATISKLKNAQTVRGAPNGAMHPEEKFKQNIKIVEK